MYKIMLMLLLAGVGNSAMADMVTRCSPPKGYSYIIPNKLPSARKSGWIKDGLAIEKILVTLDQSGIYDIVSNDDTGLEESSISNGGVTSVISKSEGYLILTVNYPESSIETWYFRINNIGVGEVTVSQARYGKSAIGGIAHTHSHTLFKASCSK